jgi:hypothetical protein
MSDPVNKECDYDSAFTLCKAPTHILNADKQRNKLGSM